MQKFPWYWWRGFIKWFTCKGRASTVQLNYIPTCSLRQLVYYVHQYKQYTLVWTSIHRCYQIYVHICTVHVYDVTLNFNPDKLLQVLPLWSYNIQYFNKICKTIYSLYTWCTTCITYTCITYFIQYADQYQWKCFINKIKLWIKKETFSLLQYCFGHKK